MTTRDESRLYDVRTLERNLRKGLISKKDYDKYLKGLSDAADKATACNPESQSREAERPHPPARVHPPHPVTVHPAVAGPDDELEDLADDEFDDDDDLDDEDDEDEAAEEP
jgi:hypothetical protein